MAKHTIVRLRYDATPLGAPLLMARLAVVEQELREARHEIAALRDALDCRMDREVDLTEEVRALRDKQWWLLYENAALQRHRPPVRMPLTQRAWCWVKAVRGKEWR